MNAKKILSLALAVMLLVAAMAVPAMADEPITITITVENAAADHVYEAYQVFTGTLSATGVLSDVEWGNGVDGAALLAALKSNDLFIKGDSNQFAGCSDAAGVAVVLGSWSYNEANVKNFADVVSQHLTSTKYPSQPQSEGKYLINVDHAGYYFIKDAEALEGADGATDYLLQVVNPVTVTPKVSAPTFSKTVNNELNTTYMHGIDAQIGDTLYFKLESKLPTLYNDYHQYVMVMEDVLPAGLEFNRVEDIYIAHAAGGSSSYMSSYTEDNTTTRSLDDAKQYGYNEAERKLTVNFGNLKISQANPNLNDLFVVKYSVVVTDDVVFGLNRDGDEANAANLGNKNEAVLYASNDMNQTDAATASLGTLSDSASVYTYQLKVTKVDGQTKAPLANAEFYLYRNIASAIPGGEPTKTYAHTDENGLITGWSTETPAHKLVSDENGEFNIQGLDSLAYHLEEVTAPEGYNKMEEAVLVTLSATITEDTLTALQCMVDGTTSAGDVNTGTVAVEVNNTAGSTLPGTGGMGTTIFYLAGGLLLVAAAVVMVSRKRKEA